MAVKHFINRDIESVAVRDMLSKYDRTFVYERDESKLVERYKQKYEDRTINIRGSRRVNINNTIKAVISSFLNSLVSNAPVKTGNLKLNGIRYKVFAIDGSGNVLKKISKDKDIGVRIGIISIGSPSAPYGVHINKNAKKPSVKGWIDRSIAMAIADINSTNLNANIEIQEREILEYGYWQIRVLVS